MPHRTRVPRVTRVTRVTRVQVIAADPITRAGTVGVLSLSRELDARTFGETPARWQPQVAVLAVERVDRTTLIQLRVARRSGIPVVLVAAAIDGFDVLAALEAGTTAMVLRSEATTERLAEVIHLAASAPSSPQDEQSYLDLRPTARPTVHQGPLLPAQRHAVRIARALTRSAALR
jgi:DNA-binding NarL/FixJ family response regulator